MEIDVKVKMYHRDIVDRYSYDTLKLRNSNIELEYDTLKKMMRKRFDKSIDYKDDNSKKLSLATIIAISQNLNISEEDIFYNEYKKPLLKNCYFNISHSNEYVVFVKSDKRIGIDIQYMSEADMVIKDYAFTENEKKYIDEDEIDKDEINRFYRLWTRKEALVKAEGSGFIREPKEVDVSESIKNDEIIYKDVKYYIKSVKFKNYYISVCSENKIRNIVIENIMH